MKKFFLWIFIILRICFGNENNLPTCGISEPKDLLDIMEIKSEYMVPICTCSIVVTNSENDTINSVIDTVFLQNSKIHFYNQFNSVSIVLIEKEKRVGFYMEYPEDNYIIKKYGYVKKLNNNLCYSFNSYYDTNFFVEDGDFIKEIENEVGKIEVYIKVRDNKCVDKMRAYKNGRLISVYSIDKDCKKHGWGEHSGFWWCYINGREMEDSACKGFKKW